MTARSNAIYVIFRFYILTELTLGHEPKCSVGLRIKSKLVGWGAAEQEWRATPSRNRAEPAQDEPGTPRLGSAEPSRAEPGLAGPEPSWIRGGPAQSEPRHKIGPVISLNLFANMEFKSFALATP